MKNQIFKQRYMLALGGGLAVLLVLLGVLQYRWLNRVSAGEHEIMQTSLRNRTEDFRNEFNREIRRAYATFQVSGDVPQTQEWVGFTQDYDNWTATAPYPRLIKNLFLAKTGNNGQLLLMHFDASVKRFEPTEWPTNLSGLRESYQQQQQSLIDAANNTQRRILTDPITEEIPALSYPIVKVTSGKQKHAAQEGELSVVIIELDLDYIKQTFIPTLAKRLLTDNGVPSYDLVVLSNSDSRVVIYSSGHKHDGDFSSGDATCNILTLTGDAKVDLSSLQVYQSVETAGTPRGDLSKINPSTYTKVVPTAVTNKLNEMLAMFKDQSGRWRVVINHDAGSLTAAVAQTRHRNMAVSFGMLSLLGVSIIMIIVIARRGQHLAQRQLEFVAGVSHEFRTPLSVIHAISENLADGLITDKQQVEQCGIVIRNDVQRLAAMVEQVLEFAGVYQGKRLYQPTPIDLPELIDRVLARAALQQPENEWHIEKDIESNLPAVLGDYAAIESAMQNVLDNAAKYGGLQCWIRVEAHSEPGKQSRSVQITIKDGGRGIAPSDLPHIFEPFYRGKEVVASQIHGNGLGLSLVKNIIEAHGGTITAVSVPGKGTTFTLRLPAATNCASA
jgi:signal transduction histidine kinase